MKGFKKKLLRNQHICFICGRPTQSYFMTIPICTECKRRELLSSREIKKKLVGGLKR